MLCRKVRCRFLSSCLLTVRWWSLLDRQCSTHCNFFQVGKNSWSGNYSCPWFLLYVFECNRAWLMSIYIYIYINVFDQIIQLSKTIYIYIYSFGELDYLVEDIYIYIYIYTHQSGTVTFKDIQKKSRTTVIAGSRILAHLKEIAMCGTLSIKQRSSPHSQKTAGKKPTSDFATQHLKNVIERGSQWGCGFYDYRLKFWLC